MTLLSDEELLESAREGDQAALAELYIRHRAAARRVAATSCRGADPDDLVNEAFEKVFAAVRRQTGPTEAFRAYLFVTMRRLAARHVSRNRDDPYDEVPEPVAAAAGGGAMDPSERDIVTGAFTSLPDRWQAVLWHTAVEGRHPREVARSMGMSANAVSALAYRAREKLRQAYLQAHLQAGPRPECEPHRSALGAYVRGGLGDREQAATARHVDRCRPCQTLVGELDDVNQLLTRALLPIFLVEGLGDVVAASGGATAATGLAGASDALGAFSPQHLAAGTAEGGIKKLLAALSASATTTKAAGGAAAALLTVGAVGTAGTRVLEDDTPPEPSVATDGSAATPETAPPGTDPAAPAARGRPLDVPAADCLHGHSAASGGSRASGDSSDGATGATDPAGGHEGTASPGSTPGTGEASSGTGDRGAGAGDDPLLGLDLGLDAPVVGDLDLPPVTVPSPEIGGSSDTGDALRIEDVRCDTSSGAGELLMTIGATDETASEPAPTTTSPTTEPPGVEVDTGDVVPEALPEVLPDVDAGVSVEVRDGVGAEVDTNLAEMCDAVPDGDGDGDGDGESRQARSGEDPSGPSGGRDDSGGGSGSDGGESSRDGRGERSLVCRLDSSLGGAVTETVSGTGAGIQVDGPGGEVLTVELREGDVVIDSRVINLLP